MRGRGRKITVDAVIRRTWHGMRHRCRNPKHVGYKNYGGRGIGICDAWFNDVEKFASYMGPKPSSLHTIERINNDGNYEPGNCKWATWHEQARNKRKRAGQSIGPAIVTAKHISDWAEYCATAYETLGAQLRLARAIDESLTSDDAFKDLRMLPEYRLPAYISRDEQAA